MRFKWAHLTGPPRDKGGFRGSRSVIGVLTLYTRTGRLVSLHDWRREKLKTEEGDTSVADLLSLLAAEWTLKQRSHFNDSSHEVFKLVHVHWRQACLSVAHDVACISTSPPGHTFPWISSSKDDGKLMAPPPEAATVEFDPRAYCSSLRTATPGA
jgi:hypothetical protein